MSKIIHLDSLFEDYKEAVNVLGSFNILKDIKIGDKIKKGHGLRYLIDSDSFVDGIQSESGDLDFEAIYNSFSGKMKEVKDMFNSRLVIPISEAYEKGVGECLEKSIATYFLLNKVDNIEENIVVNGSIGRVGGFEVSMHSFNVAKVNNLWYLVDSHNPLSKDPFFPFYNRVEGIKIKPGLPFVFGEGINTDRNYYLK